MSQLLARCDYLEQVFATIKYGRKAIVIYPLGQKSKAES
jgi:hypothetical protein